MSDACSASRAVSLSRTSPTRMTSGSWRRMERRPAANVRPAFSGTDLGDAGQADLDRVLERDDVLFPAADREQCAVERAGLTGTGRTGDQHQALRLAHRMQQRPPAGPRAGPPGRAAAGPWRRGSRRMTMLSPGTRAACSSAVDVLAAVDEARAAVLRAPALEMSRPAMIFKRLARLGPAIFGTVMTSRSWPSTRKRTTTSVDWGSMWMSLAPWPTPRAGSCRRA